MNVIHKPFIILFSVLVAASVLLSCSSTRHTAQRMPGKWQATPIVADGDSKDWPAPYPDYDERAMLGYCVTNDKDNLYITVQTGDAATQLKILKEGLTVWIDKTGGKEEQTGINFPIPESHFVAGNANSKRPPAMKQEASTYTSLDQQRLELEDRVRESLANAKEFSLQGFKSCNLQYRLDEKDSCGVVVNIGIDGNNELIWEAVVPFRSFYFKPELTRADKGKVMTLCIETTGADKPASQGGPGRSRVGVRPGFAIGGGGMGMGMQMGGGGGYRGGTQPNNLMESLYKSTKTYRKFGLAFQ